MSIQNPEDDNLKSYLDGGSQISMLYDETKESIPAAHIDVEILKEARNAVDKNKRKQSWINIWSVPISTATIVLLAIGIIAVIPDQEKMSTPRIDIPITDVLPMDEPVERKIKKRADKEQSPTLDSLLPSTAAPEKKDSDTLEIQNIDKIQKPMVDAEAESDLMKLEEQEKNINESMSIDNGAGRLKRMPTPTRKSQATSAPSPKSDANGAIELDTTSPDTPIPQQRAEPSIQRENLRLHDEYRVKADNSSLIVLSQPDFEFLILKPFNEVTWNNVHPDQWIQYIRHLMDQDNEQQIKKVFQSFNKRFPNIDLNKKLKSR